MVGENIYVVDASGVVHYVPNGTSIIEYIKELVK